MALVVESTATASTSSSTDVVIAKPTGLQVGDLMVAILGAYATTYSTLSGWTSELSLSAGEGGVSVQYKVADSGDVSASNFTFVAGTPTLNVGAILRVSGYNTLEEIVFSQDDSDLNSAGSTVSFSTSVTPNDNALLVSIFTVTNPPSGGVYAMGGYNVTGVSTSWTEVFDVGIDLGNNSTVIAGAYSIITTTAEITAYGASISASMDDHITGFIVLNPSVDAEGSNTLVETTTTVQSQSGICDGVGGNAVTETDTEVFTQSGLATSPTQWTNESKPSTTWTNEDK